MSGGLFEVRVARKLREADDIYSFELVPKNAQKLPSFSAGSHIDVRVRGDFVRQYSLFTRSQDNAPYQIAVLLEPASRGGSLALHREVHEGDTLFISEPRNHFPLRETTGTPLLLAGGIGVTPILCMAESLAHFGADFAMHYWTRTPSRTAFLDRIQRSEFKEKVHIHFDDGPDHQRMPLARVFSNTTPGRRAYICGPFGFLEAAHEAARQAAWAEDHIHSEYFAGQFAEVGASPKSTFEIEIASSGAVYVVPPEKTVAQILAEHCVEVPLSCEQGVCGTCLTMVLAGVPDHRDVLLTNEEKAKNDRFTPCCSRSLSQRLVLDL